MCGLAFDFAVAFGVGFSQKPRANSQKLSAIGAIAIC
jgi:hypothetical protein